VQQRYGDEKYMKRCSVWTWRAETKWKIYYQKVRQY